MGLDGGGPVETRPCAGPTGDGFIILTRLVAEGEIVHRSLAGGQDAQRAVKRIHHGLAGLDIARHHGGGIARVQHRAFRHDQFDRFQATFV
ncbi:hypothetical protein D3C75_769370 [compost metagenome]